MEMNLVLCGKRERSFLLQVVFKMEILTLFFITTLILFPPPSSPHAVAASGDRKQRLVGWVPTRSVCRGTVTDCLAAVEKLELDSEFACRILATSRYISYGALQGYTVPCSRRGASYYNCRSGAQANPYSRGCSAITRCRVEKREIGDGSLSCL